MVGGAQADRKVLALRSRAAVSASSRIDLVAASAFLLLGQGARGVFFRGRRYPIPFGWIDWIRGRGSDWETGEQWPVIFTEVRDELIPNPPEWSSEWLDLSPAAGRFVIHIDMSGPCATRKEAALAVVDFLLGFQAFRIPLDLDWTLVELPAATYRRGEILVQDLPNDD